MLLRSHIECSISWCVKCLMGDNQYMTRQGKEQIISPVIVTVFSPVLPKYQKLYC